MKQIIFYLIIAILVFATYGSWNLSRVDYRKKNICPKILSIPACYIVFIFFLLTLVVHVLMREASNTILYFSFVAVPFLLALAGTITELSGKVICPRTPGGTPMCFISLGITTTLLILKIIEKNIV